MSWDGSDDSKVMTEYGEKSAEAEKSTRWPCRLPRQVLWQILCYEG